MASVVSVVLVAAGDVVDVIVLLVLVGKFVGVSVVLASDVALVLVE